MSQIKTLPHILCHGVAESQHQPSQAMAHALDRDTRVSPWRPSAPPHLLVILTRTCYNKGRAGAKNPFSCIMASGREAR